MITQQIFPYTHFRIPSSNNKQKHFKQNNLLTTLKFSKQSSGILKICRRIPKILWKVHLQLFEKNDSCNNNQFHTSHFQNQSNKQDEHNCSSNKISQEQIKSPKHQTTPFGNKHKQIQTNQNTKEQLRALDGFWWTIGSRIRYCEK